MERIIIPAKPLNRAKARLAAVLGASERRRLTLAMLADVCAAAAAASSDVWVVGSDAETFDVARRAGAKPVEDPTPSAGLVPSLNAVMPGDAGGVLILSSDLPAVTADDIRAVAEGAGVALAPDRAGSGTNALWRNPAAAIALAFGAGSRRAHEDLARASGVPFRLVTRPGLALDVDTPQDLDAAWGAPLGDATRRVLEELGFPTRLRRFA
jgi:2-phospho-L-lactate/phosphoenolpyruvate guanylyltransferase